MKLLAFESYFMPRILFDKLIFQIVNQHIVVKRRLYHVNQLFAVQISPYGLSFCSSHIFPSFSRRNPAGWAVWLLIVLGIDE